MVTLKFLSAQEFIQRFQQDSSGCSLTGRSQYYFAQRGRFSQHELYGSTSQSHWLAGAFLTNAMNLQNLEQWREQLQGDVGLVLLTHVYFNSSLRIAVSDLLAPCRQRGIFSVVDIAQSIGLYPLICNSGRQILFWALE